MCDVFGYPMFPAQRVMNAALTSLRNQIFIVQGVFDVYVHNQLVH